MNDGISPCCHAAIWFHPPRARCRNCRSRIDLLDIIDPSYRVMMAVYRTTPVTVVTST